VTAGNLVFACYSPYIWDFLLCKVIAGFYDLVFNIMISNRHIWSILVELCGYLCRTAYQWPISLWGTRLQDRVPSKGTVTYYYYICKSILTPIVRCRNHNNADDANVSTHYSIPRHLQHCARHLLVHILPGQTTSRHGCPFWGIPPIRDHDGCTSTPLHEESNELHWHSIP
jgi:hypothetical protein